MCAFCYADRASPDDVVIATKETCNDVAAYLRRKLH